jgi:hypothetical protein
VQPWVHLDLSYPNFSDRLICFGRSVAAERSGAHGHNKSSESVYCTRLMLFDRGEHAISHVILAFSEWLRMLID